MIQKQINLVCGNNLEILEQHRDYTLYRTKQDSGEGTVREYQLWEGVFLGIMDLNLDCIDYSQLSMEGLCDFICVNHCHSGLFEAEFQNGQWVHLNEGDSSINLPENTPISHRFPLGRYKGAILILDLEKLKISFQTVLGEESPINFHSIKENVSKHNCFVVYIHQQDQYSLHKIWREFYKENVSLFYLKLKCLELFHILNLEESTIPKSCRYYEKQQRYKVNQTKATRT